MSKKIFVFSAMFFALMSAPFYSASANESSASELGRIYGQHHAEHARDGMIGKDMNPGMHKGFSGWDHDSE